MATSVSSGCTTPNLSRTSTTSEDSCASDASLAGLYTPANPSREPSHSGSGVGKDTDVGLHANTGDDNMRDLLDWEGLEASLNDVNANMTLRGNMKSAIKRAGTLVKNRFTIARTFKELRSSGNQEKAGEGGSVADSQEHTNILHNALTPLPTPDLPTIHIEDLGDLPPNPDLGATPRPAPIARRLSARHAITHSAYPYLFNKDDNVNISATSLLAVCGSPVPTFVETDDKELFATDVINELGTIVLCITVLPFWCAFIGLCIITSPKSIQQFTPTTLPLGNPGIATDGIRRFNYWVQTAIYHILLAVLPMIVSSLWYPKSVALLAAAMVAKSWWEWKDFVREMRTGARGPIDFGDNDMESIYLIVTDIPLKEILLKGTLNIRQIVGHEKQKEE